MKKRRLRMRAGIAVGPFLPGAAFPKVPAVGTGNCPRVPGADENIVTAATRASVKGREKTGDPAGSHSNRDVITRDGD